MPSRITRQRMTQRIQQLGVPTYTQVGRSPVKRGYSTTGKSVGAQKKVSELSQIKYTPYVGTGGSRAVALDKPSWYMGMTNVPQWVANPTKTYQLKDNGSVEMYLFPDDSRYYVNPNGAVVKVNRKGDMYLYKDGLYEDAPYEQISYTPSWLKGIL